MKTKTFKSDDIVIKWTWQDVKQLRPEMSNSEAHEMLDKIAKHFERNCISSGWDIMEILIQMEE